MRTALTAAAVVLAMAAGTAGERPEAVAFVPAAATATSLKIMDWNIQGGTGTDGRYDFGRIIDVIAAENPDIVTLQEVHDNSSVGGDNQWQLLVNRFPAYKPHFAKGDTNAFGGVAGNLILSKYDIIEKLTYQLPQYPADSAAVLRSLGGVKINVNGTDVRIYTTHLSPGLGTEATERRNRQARAVIDKVSSASLMPTPMLLTGDLNVRPDNEIRPWFAQAGWYDAWTQVNANIGAGVITHPGDGDDARIDYVYATPGLEVADAHTVATIASDHYPVVANVTTRATAATKAKAVLAGAAAREGWANLAVYADSSSKLRVCDNLADGWGVRAYVRARSGGSVVATGSDGAYADRCGTFTTGSGTVSSPTVRVCLYKGGEEKDCREVTVT
ncbi:endonuclease/exonuclease/phosphatase family protein [Nonomuraea sp. NPDC050786]|uniref:endonuclease/exonuclease/phosphatase family protein n=1 Tax=Nonomuraea sp. NPDC050786 TaxID=3154840 RepID=UPI0033F8728D